MTENSENSKQIIHAKEKLYKFYYDLLEEVKGEKIQVNDSDYEENVLNTKLSTIIHYIKETIGVLLKKKSASQGYSNFSENEKRLVKLENDIRYYIKKQFQYKIQCEALEMKLESYLEMEEEFEEMKEKLKYEEGTFLDNDRKENEILILRAENSNLKKVIEKLEEDKKAFETERKNDKEIINDLKTQIENLAKKVSKLENQNNPNSSINININNNGSASSKWVIKHEDIDRENYGSTYSRIVNDFPKPSPKKNQPKHHKTNSVNMNDNAKKNEIMSKYFSNHGVNTKSKNYMKISNLMQNAKHPSKPQNTNQVSSLSKIYNSSTNKTSFKSANRTMVSVRSTSRLSEHY